MVEGCLTRVRHALPGLEGARLRVASFVLSEPWAAHGLAIGELADRSDVSENAVSRFTRAVGYSGYRAFSQALSVDLGRSMGVAHDQPVELVEGAGGSGNDLTKLVARVFELEISCVRDTLANLDEAQLEAAIALLSEAHRILLIGTGAAAPLCQMTQYRLSNLGLEATWASDPMVMVSETSRLGQHDVVIGISYSGESRATLDVLTYANSRRGAKTICLTAVRNSRIAEVSDIPLVMFGTNVSVGTAQFSARVSGMVLLEAISTAVAVKKYGGISPNLEELAEMQGRINNVEGNRRPSRERRSARLPGNAPID